MNHEPSSSPESANAASAVPASPPPSQTSTSSKPRPNTLLELTFTIIIPSAILMLLSGEDRLGTLPALLLSLAFPLGWGIWDGITRRAVSLLAVLGIVSTLLTGGIGLMKLDAEWLAVKEASMSAVIGLIVLGSTWTRSPLIRLLVFNAQLFDVPRIERALAERGTRAAFDAQLRRGTMLLAGTFFFSAVANYVLARAVVVSAAGTEAFNQELGRLTLLSYPVIALPSMVMMMALMWWLAHGARRLTGMALHDMLSPST